MEASSPTAAAAAAEAVSLATDVQDFKISRGLTINLLDKHYANLVFTEASDVRAESSSLRSKVRPYLALLKTPSSSGKRKDFSKISFNSLVFVSENGGFQWSHYHCTLSGFHVQFRKPGKKQVHHKTVTYSFNRTFKNLARTKGPPFANLDVLQVFFESGRSVDIRGDGNGPSIQALGKRLESVWKKKFSKDELAERIASAHRYERFLLAESRLSVKAFSFYARSWWKKIEHRTLPLLSCQVEAVYPGSSQQFPLFLELHQFCLILFNHQQPPRKLIKFFVLNILYIDEAHSHGLQLSLRTPENSFRLIFETAQRAQEMKEMLSYIFSDNKAAVSQIAQRQMMNFSAVKTTKEALSLIRRDTNEVWDLSNTGPWTIGRSRDQYVLLDHDKTVSRRHALIEHINRSYIITDLGTRTGLKVNNFSLPKSHLAIGDIINIAFTFLEVVSTKEIHATGQVKFGPSGSPNKPYHPQKTSGSSETLGNAGNSTMDSEVSYGMFESSRKGDSFSDGNETWTLEAKRQKVLESLSLEAGALSFDSGPIDSGPSTSPEQRT